MKAKTVQEYISLQPAEVQARLHELRRYLMAADNNAIDELKWGKPALVNDGILYVYAAAKNHISLHPTPSVISYFQEELGPLVTSQNTIRFAVSEPIPKDLVSKIAAHRVFEKEHRGVKWK